MIHAAEAGERQHGHPRRQVEAARHVRRAERDLDQVFCRGFDVDAGIGQEEDFSFARDHGVAAGNAVQAFAHAHDLQRRADRVGEMLRHAGNQRVGVAHVHHHRSEDIAVVDQRLGLLQGDTPPLPQAEQFQHIGSR